MNKKKINKDAKKADLSKLFGSLKRKISGDKFKNIVKEGAR